jgi:hypothetical protein
VSAPLIIAEIVSALLLLYGAAVVVAGRAVRRTALTVAIATGLDADAVDQQIVRRKIPPASGAVEHGLDPATFRPRGTS